MKASLLRQQFPFLDGRCYLDTAAAGLSWPGQGAAVADFYNGAKGSGINGRSLWMSRAESAERRVRQLLGGFEGDLVFPGSTTEALNLVAHALPWCSADEVVYAADEFPSVVSAWSIAALHAAQLCPVHVPTEAQRTDVLCAAISAATKVVAVSHVHWVTGTMVDLERLGQKCREHGALLVVDGIQAMGAVPIDVSAADIYCGSVFKWLLSGFGLAIMGISKRAAEKMTPAMRGYANPSPSRSLKYGHANYPGLYALDGSLEYLDSIGWEYIYTRVMDLVEYLSGELSELGYSVCAPIGARAGIVSFTVPSADLVCDALAREGVDVAERQGVLRCSPHFYNSRSDVDRLLSTLQNFKLSSQQ